MASFSEKIAERANARRKIVEEHMKVVAAHTSLSDFQPRSHLDSQGSDDEGKENISDDDTRLRTLTKKRLRTLGGLYSGEEVSSPIQRTEGEFCVEDVQEARPSARSSERAQRLARLASTINQWEDDLSHPVLKKQEPVHYDKFGNVLRTSPAKKKFGVVSTNESRTNKRDTGSPLKKALGNEVKETKKDSESVKSKRVMWDSSVIVALENQGFERCESEQHLVYDYKEHLSPAKCLSPSPKKKIYPSEETPKTPSSSKKKQLALQDTKSTNLAPSSAKKKTLSTDATKSAKVTRSSPPEADSLPKTKEVPQPPPLPTVSSLPPKAPETTSQASKGPKKEEPESSAKNQARLASAIVKELTPVKVVTKAMVHSPSRSDLQLPAHRSPSPRKATQVLEMAAQYEVSTSPTKKKETDPSELPLSQRKALFEKNKGSAILPKAPFSMAVPAKVLNANHRPTTAGVVSQQKQVKFSDSSSEDKLNKIREERQREMDMLKVRWDKNKLKNGTGAPAEDLHPARADSNEEEEDEDDIESCEGVCSDSDDMRCPSTGNTPVKRDDQHWPEESDIKESAHESSPERCPNTGDTPKSSKKNYPMLKDVKRIKLSPPKPGHIYPSISDIEMETETETENEQPENNNLQSGYENDDSMGDSSDASLPSLGQTIVEIANRSSSNLKRRQDSTSEEEARVLGEMDDILNCALKEPSPKRSKDSSFEDFVNQKMTRCESGSIGTDSFEYSHADSDCPTTDVDQSKPGTQLVHTISLYRKQKQMTITATTTIKREQVGYRRIDEDKEWSEEMEQKDVRISEDQLVADKIKELLLEMTKQQTIISQASQALNLCSSTIEFSGSSEQIEAERLLLIASQRRLALNHEVDRLRVEKKLMSTCSISSGERGDLTIHNICLPLKMDVIRTAAREEKCYNMVVLVRSGPTVLASEMQTALPKNLKQSEPFMVHFKTPLTLKQLYSDFTVTLEVYSLEARSKELLPHDIKYHITPSAKKEKLKMTPKKASKNDTRLIVGPIESPGGPQAVRSTSFKMNGFAVFSLREINKTNFSLSKVSYGSVVEGNIQVKMSCEMTLAGLEYHGFLTIFQDVAGFGAWHRRWCYLKENTISTWLYPEHETSKIPLDSIDLRECCTDGEVGLVPRDVCARPNTFLIEIMRPRQPSDQDSLVMKTSKHSTLIRHLMSADTREDRLEWCSRINKCLALLKAWGKRPSVKHTDL